MNFNIVEEYDGRLPVYHVINNNTIIKTFDSYKEAETFCNNSKKNIGPCGEEIP